jgi:hypothetical protein
VEPSAPSAATRGGRGGRTPQKNCTKAPGAYRLVVFAGQLQGSEEAAFGPGMLFEVKVGDANLVPQQWVFIWRKGARSAWVMARWAEHTGVSPDAKGGTYCTASVRVQSSAGP